MVAASSRITLASGRIVALSKSKFTPRRTIFSLGGGAGSAFGGGGGGGGGGASFFSSLWSRRHVPAPRIQPATAPIAAPAPRVPELGSWWMPACTPTPAPPPTSAPARPQ